MSNYRLNPKQILPAFKIIFTNEPQLGLTVYVRYKYADKFNDQLVVEHVKSRRLRLSHDLGYDVFVVYLPDFYNPQIAQNYRNVLLEIVESGDHYQYQKTPDSKVEFYSKG